MRLFLLAVLSAVFLIGITGELSALSTALPGVGGTQLLFSSPAAAFGSPQQPVRSPDAVTGHPGAWPQQDARKMVEFSAFGIVAGEVARPNVDYCFD